MQVYSQLDIQLTCLGTTSHETPKVELGSRLGQATLDGMGNGPVEYLKNILE